MTPIPCCFATPRRPELCWMVTVSCNLKCSFCSVFENPFVSQYRGVESHNDISRVVFFAQQHQVEKVVLTGGEPTASRWLIPAMDSLTETNIPMSLSTNATLL